MNWSFTSPWHVLLWIAALLLIAGPIIAFNVNWIFTCWFRSKEAHQIRMIKTFSEAIEKASKEIQAQMQKKKKPE